MALVVWRTGTWKLEIVKRLAAIGFEILSKRWIVERTFAWISRNRCLARDFERYATTVAAFVRLAMIRIMLRRLAAANAKTSRMGSEGCRRAEKTLIASVFINVDKSRNALDLT